MTRIALKRDKLFGYSEIKIVGHSGYSEEGSDIVCAYISSATDLLMSILIDEFGLEIETDIDPESALVCLRVSPTSDNEAKADIISGVTAGFASQMKELSNQFSQYVSIKIV